MITPNPKTSGGARWNYLAAWGFALKRELGDLRKVSDPAEAKNVEAAEAKAKAFVTALYKNVPVLDSGARGATTTFTNRGIGDVLINWENEILLGTKETGGDQFEVVIPPLSILAEPTVSVVDKNAEKHGTKAAAEAYLNFLYSEKGQELAAKNFYRPQNLAILTKNSDKFPKLELFTLAQIAGDWKRAQKTHFDDGGVLRSNLPSEMTSLTEQAPLSEPHKGGRGTLKLRTRGVLPGFGLSMGYTVLYLSVLVLIPLSALFLKASALGPQQFWEVVTHPRALAAYRLTFGASLASALINAVMGLLLAWVLVRYRFFGKALIDALIDLPFALPTAVAGIAMTTAYAPNGFFGRTARSTGAQGGLRAAGGGRGAHVRGAPLRRANGAARARRARP